ncbi:MAG: hypothetical protein KDB53_00515, partial [Planctomycetes bacterium]|nr:hypothetical protein [Planctomycetota bacterium]
MGEEVGGPEGSGDGEAPDSARSASPASPPGAWRQPFILAMVLALLLGQVVFDRFFVQREFHLAVGARVKDGGVEVILGQSLVSRQTGVEIGHYGRGDLASLDRFALGQVGVLHAVAGNERGPMLLLDDALVVDGLSFEFGRRDGFRALDAARDDTGILIVGRLDDGPGSIVVLQSDAAGESFIQRPLTRTDDAGGFAAILAIEPATVALADQVHGVRIFRQQGFAFHEVAASSPLSGDGAVRGLEVLNGAPRPQLAL